MSSEVRKTVNTSLNTEKEIIFKNVYAGASVFLVRAVSTRHRGSGAGCKAGAPVPPPAGPPARWAGPRRLPAGRRCRGRELAGTGGCLGSSGRFAEASELRGAALETAAPASVDAAVSRSPCVWGPGRTPQDARAPRAPSQARPELRARTRPREARQLLLPGPRPSPPSPPDSREIRRKTRRPGLRLGVWLTLKTSSVRKEQLGHHEKGRQAQEERHLQWPLGQDTAFPRLPAGRPPVPSVPQTDGWPDGRADGRRAAGRETRPGAQLRGCGACAPVTTCLSQGRGVCCSHLRLSCSFSGRRFCEFF